MEGQDVVELDGLYIAAGVTPRAPLRPLLVICVNSQNTATFFAILLQEPEKDYSPAKNEVAFRQEANRLLDHVPCPLTGASPVMVKSWPPRCVLRAGK